jgi:20S proteasome alpha/beta subunit
MENGTCNLLERERKSPQRFRKPFHRKRLPIKKTMTLIIGIVCHDGIVMAAESQTTKGNSKLLGTNKISIVEFEHDKVLVAEAGSANLSNHAIELFQRKARGVKIDNDSTVPKLVQKSVFEVVEKLLEPFKSGATPAQIQDFLLDEINKFELMVAYYFQKKPYLYMFRSALAGIPDKVKTYFETSGIGADLADYILTKYIKENSDSEFASVIAVKALQDVSNHVEGCGGPLRMASLHHRGMAATILAPSDKWRVFQRKANSLLYLGRCSLLT